MAETSKNTVCSECNADLPADFRFCGFCGTAVKAGVTDGKTAGRAQHRNERRDVAILFADVSGFTSMCETMDPEDVFTLMNEVFAGLGRAINMEGGHIDKYIGDNVMALFGAPVAHEDDPTRACRAAIGMQSFLTQFALKLFSRTGIMLKMRIGINCGLVLAGYVGSDVKREYSVLGDTVNLAARLESKAPPGGIMISEAMARRISGFVLGPAQELTVKGKAQPVRAFEITGEQKDHAPGRMAATAFIGRKKEMEILSRHLCKKRRPFRPVFVTGEAGLGKTRLFSESLHANPGLHCLRGSALTGHGHQPFGFLRRFLRENLPEISQIAGLLENGDSLKSFLINLSPELADFFHIFNHLLIEDNSAAQPPDLDPVIFRQTTETGIEKLFDALTQKFPPLVIILDSFDSADEASRNLFLHLLKRPAGPPCPIAVGSRLDLTNPADVKTVPLKALEEADAKALLRELFAEEVPSEAVIRELLARAAGNPMFLEEYARWSRQAKDSPNRSGGALPPNLRALVVSSLDRLSRETHDFLTACSIQGREFDLVIGAEATDTPTADLYERVFPELQAADLVYPCPGAGRSIWAFRQQLLQDVCYETMLITERRRLHMATAKAICNVAGGEVAASPVALAYHYERAEAWQASAMAKVRAGNQSRSFGLNLEACDWFSGALADLKNPGEDCSGQDSLHFSIYQGLSQALVSVGKTKEAASMADLLEKYATTPASRIEARRIQAQLARIQGNADQAETCFKEAIAWSEQQAESTRNAQLFLDFAEHLLKRGRFAEAQHAADNFRRLAENTRRASIQADTIAGKISYAQGDFAKARELFSSAFQAALSEPGLSEKARTANHLGNVEKDLGNYQNARCYFQDALDSWEKTGDAEGIAGANNNLGNLAMSMGDFDAAEKYHTETLKRWQTHGNIAGAALSQANLAVLALERDNGDQAVSFAREALASLGSGGNEMLVALIKVIEGDGLLTAGDCEAAERKFSAVLADYDGAKAKLAHAGATRGLGRILLLRNIPQDALAMLQDAANRFLGLKRIQEAARTMLWVADAQLKTGRQAEARATLQRAMQDFDQMKADRDSSKAAERLRLIEINANPEKEPG